MNQSAINQAADDVRLELSMAAAASERANRPRFLIFIAAGLLVVSVAYTTASWASLRGVDQEVRLQQARISSIQALVAEVRQLQLMERKEVFDPDPAIPGRLRELARDAGVAGDLSILSAPDRASKIAGVVKKIYNAKASAQEAPAVIEWLMSATEGKRIPGIQILMLRLKPGAPAQSGAAGWDLEVTFTRLERTN